jgi:hypothetical protein
MDWISDNRVLRGLDSDKHAPTAAEKSSAAATRSRIKENAHSNTVI